MPDSLSFRPRFKFYTSLSIEEFTEKITSFSKTSKSNILVKKTYHHLDLSFRKEDIHFWSPHMDISLEREEQGDQTLVRCLIAPMPTVWTMFMFLYSIFGLASIIGIIIGTSQWSLGKPVWGFLVFGASILGIAGMYFASYEGKERAADEMHQLKHFMDEALDCDCFDLVDSFE